MDNAEEPEPDEDELEELREGLGFLMEKLVEISHHLTIINIALHRAGIELPGPKITIQ